MFVDDDTYLLHRHIGLVAASCKTHERGLSNR